MTFYWIILFELTLLNEKLNETFNYFSFYLFICLEDHDTVMKMCEVCEIQFDLPQKKYVFVELKRSNKKSCLVSDPFTIKFILCLTEIGLLSKNIELQHYLHFLIAFTFPHL